MSLLGPGDLQPGRFRAGSDHWIDLHLQAKEEAGPVRERFMMHSRKAREAHEF